MKPERSSLRRGASVESNHCHAVFDPSASIANYREQAKFSGGTGDSSARKYRQLLRLIAKDAANQGTAGLAHRRAAAALEV